MTEWHTECRYCGQTFIREIRSGKPRRYCDAHHHSTYRNRVLRQERRRNDRGA